MKLFATHVRDKGLVSPIYRECLGIDMCKDNNPTEKWAKAMNRDHRTGNTERLFNEKRRLIVLH